MCTVLLPPSVNPIAVKYIISIQPEAWMSVCSQVEVSATS